MYQIWYSSQYIIAAWLTVVQFSAYYQLNAQESPPIRHIVLQHSIADWTIQNKVTIQKMYTGDCNIGHIT